MAVNAVAVSSPVVYQTVGVLFSASECTIDTMSRSGHSQITPGMELRVLSSTTCVKAHSSNRVPRYSKIAPPMLRVPPPMKCRHPSAVRSRVWSRNPVASAIGGSAITGFFGSLANCVSDESTARARQGS